jgi:hypothetical protein
MSALTRNPINKDLLQSTKFRLTFQRLPEVTYFCQTAMLPGVSLTEVPRNTPFVDLYSPGEKIQYDPMTISFLVDEDIQSWLHIHDWIRACTFPTNFNEYRNLQKLNMGATGRNVQKAMPQFSDATLSIYTNKNNPNIRVKLYDMFPVTLDGLQFSSMDSAENIITATATFRFSYFNIDKIS